MTNNFWKLDKGKYQCFSGEPYQVMTISKEKSYWYIYNAKHERLQQDGEIERFSQLWSAIRWLEKEYGYSIRN
jgi:hypothetical protein